MKEFKLYVPEKEHLDDLIEKEHYLQYKIINFYQPFLFFNSNGSVTWTKDYNYFKRHKLPEITLAEFYALSPEDVQDKVERTHVCQNCKCYQQQRCRRHAPVYSIELKRSVYPSIENDWIHWCGDFEMADIPSEEL